MSDYLEKMKKLGKNYDEMVPLNIYSYSQLLAELEKMPKPVLVKSGIEELDNLIGGFEAGRLYVLSAQTKHGKTTLAQTFMYNMARKKEASLIFSYEMGWPEIVNKFKDMDLAMGFSEPTDLPLYLPKELHRGGGELQFQWLYEAMAKAKEEQNIRLAVIDHLHFLLPLKDFNNLSSIIGGIVREIKRIAVALQISIILIAHTQKVKDDKIPDISDLRDSSFIGQEADVVLMLYRIKNELTSKKITSASTETTFSNTAILSLEADRKFGRTGKIKLSHNGVMFVPWTETEEMTQEIRKVVNKQIPL